MLPYDPHRARRKLRRYLGPAQPNCDARFNRDAADGDTRFVQLRPRRLTARDLFFAATTW